LKQDEVPNEQFSRIKIHMAAEYAADIGRGAAVSTARQREVPAERPGFRRESQGSNGGLNRCVTPDERTVGVIRSNLDDPRRARWREYAGLSDADGKGLSGSGHRIERRANPGHMALVGLFEGFQGQVNPPGIVPPQAWQGRPQYALQAGDALSHHFDNLSGDERTHLDRGIKTNEAPFSHYMRMSILFTGSRKLRREVTKFFFFFQNVDICYCPMRSPGLG